MQESPNKSHLKKKLISAIYILGIAFFLVAVNALPTQTDDETEKKIILGQKLYSNWIVEVQVPAPLSVHPLWQEGIISEESSWQCVSCHGADYRGVGDNGVSLWESGKLSAIEFESWILGQENIDHDFSLYFDQEALENLAVFIKYGISDIIVLFDPMTEQLLGTSSDGEENYKLLCSSCHGLDGARINFGNVNAPYFIGDVMFESPWDVANAVRFGHANNALLSSFQVGLTLQDVADLVLYTAQFPLSQVIQSNLPLEVDYSEQGDTLDIIYGALLIVAVIFFGVLWGNRIRFG